MAFLRHEPASHLFGWGEGPSSTGRETSEVRVPASRVVRQSGRTEEITSLRGFFFPPGDWYEHRKSHTVSSVLSPHPGYINRRFLGFCSATPAEARCWGLLLSQALGVASGTNPQARDLASCHHRHLRPSNIVKGGTGPFSLKQPPTLV